jgi:hypothetical protein
MKQHGCCLQQPYPPSKDIIIDAIKAGASIDDIEWMIDNGFEWNPDALYLAPELGRYDLFAFIRRKKQENPERKWICDNILVSLLHGFQFYYLSVVEQMFWITYFVNLRCKWTYPEDCVKILKYLNVSQLSESVYQSGLAESLIYADE